MTSTELVVFPKDLVLHEGRRERRERERREARNRWRIIASCSATAIASVIVAATIVNQPPGTAHASEVPVEETAPAPTTTWPDPDPLPTQTAPGWETIRIRAPGGETLGRLITDGRHAGYDNRVLPGEVGVSVISVDSAVDLSTAASVVVGGQEWLIYYRGEVNAENINPLFKRADAPQVTLLMETPAAKRPYVEMRLK